LGLACGLGQFTLALAGLAVALLTLFVGRPIEIFLERVFSAKHDKARATEAHDPREGDD
jgi:uncharacterized membrane protein YhiD involved in acid resistance